MRRGPAASTPVLIKTTELLGPSLALAACLARFAACWRIMRELGLPEGFAPGSMQLAGWVCAEAERSP